MQNKCRCGVYTNYGRTCSRCLDRSLRDSEIDWGDDEYFEEWSEDDEKEGWDLVDKFTKKP